MDAIVSYAQSIIATHDPYLIGAGILFVVSSLALAYLLCRITWYASRNLRARLADRLEPVPDDSAVALLRRTADQPMPRGGSIASPVRIDRSRARMDRTVVDGEVVTSVHPALANMPIADQVMIERVHQERLDEAGWRPGTGGNGLPPHGDVPTTEWACEHDQILRPVTPKRVAPPTQKLQKPMLGVVEVPWSMPKPAPARVVDERDELVTLAIPAPVVNATAPEPETEPETREHTGILRRLRSAAFGDDYEGATLASATPTQDMRAADVCPELPSWGVYTTAEHERIIGQIITHGCEKDASRLAVVVQTMTRELLHDMPELADRVKPSSYEWTGEIDKQALDALLAEPIGAAS